MSVLTTVRLRTVDIIISPPTKRTSPEPRNWNATKDDQVGRQTVSSPPSSATIVICSRDSSHPSMDVTKTLPSSSCPCDRDNSSSSSSSSPSSWGDTDVDIVDLFSAPDNNGGSDDYHDNNNNDSLLLTAVVSTSTRNRDIFHQWDALFEREKLNVYAIAYDPTHFVPEDQRLKLCHWSYAVVDKYDLSRHNVNIAMAYFDRLVSNGWVEHNEWSLASVTCLFLAIKINSIAGRAFEPGLMAHESVYFTADQIIDMEDHICQVFDWYLNPPVPSQFIDILSPLLLTEPMHTVVLKEDDEEEEEEEEEEEDSVQGIVLANDPIRQELLRQSNYLCELSAMDSFFVDKEPSSVAFASILIAMDALPFPPGVMKWITLLPLMRDREETEECARRLYQIYCGGNVSDNHTTDGENTTSHPHHDEGKGTSSSSSSTTTTTTTLIRAVTPTKDDAPPDIKRMRRNATIEPLNV